MSMFPIASFYGSSAAFANLTFNNIPQNFAHLQLRISSRSTFNPGSNADYQGGLYLDFNYPSVAGDYGWGHYTLGVGSGTGFSGSFNQTASTVLNFVDGGGPFANQLANVFEVCILDILDYSSTTKLKTVRQQTGTDLNGTSNGTGRVGMMSGYYNKTNAISSMRLNTDGNFAQFTRIDLYGIAASNATGA